MKQLLRSDSFRVGMVTALLCALLFHGGMSFEEFRTSGEVHPVLLGLLLGVHGLLAASVAGVAYVRERLIEAQRELLDSQRDLMDKVFTELMERN